MTLKDTNLLKKNKPIHQNLYLTNYDHETIREDVIKRFNISKIAEQYIELYNQLCR